MCALILRQVQDERGEHTNNIRLSDLRCAHPDTSTSSQLRQGFVGHAVVNTNSGLRCAHPELVEGLSAKLSANFIKTVPLFSISLELQ